MALTSARDILNKKILRTGGSVPSADEIPIDIEGLSATKLSVGLEEIVLDIDQLSASVLTIGEKVENLTEYSSTDEHIVGKWIDGDDIYEKVITGQLQSGDQDISLTGMNIKKMIEISGIAERIPSVAIGTIQYPISGIDANNISFYFKYYELTETIRMVNKIPTGETYGNYYIILRYTKNAAESKKRTIKKSTK